ncbi:amidohydrolase family protein [Catalinimonas sp. 4WD22]|uniref:amidohydrolase family protein n=1 Tax=Catalinimonas locisalis TaxID=3133978 RepID=UPI0031019C6B
MLERRAFVKVITTATLGALAVDRKHSEGKHNILLNNMRKKEEVIEWNAHIFSPDVQKYPFHPKATYQPDVSKQPDDPLAAYLDRLDEEGIDKAVIVHPEPYGDDHSLMLDCLKREPDRLRGTSLFYPKDTDAPRKLRDLVKQEPHIVATRFHAHRGKENYLDSFADAGVRALWKQAVDLGVIIELHIGPNYAKQAGEAINAFPGSIVLIDHLAEPDMGTGVEFADVLELAKYPGVYMKLSGLNHFAEDEPLYESALPFTSRVIKEFGPERMVWGSGTPQIVDAHMKGYSKTDIAKVKGGNLSKLLNW